MNTNDVQIRKGIFIPISLTFLGIIIVGLVAPKLFYDALNAIVEFAFLNFGWLFQISGNIFLFICLWWLIF